ncbi:MAG: hypothetical protein GX754_09020 [Clostridiaceae bacterium]|nr:hypothetical protein [Clostridiaceae bacterium]
MGNNKLTRQYVLSPAAGKRLIARALLHIPSILEALASRTVVIAAGTTNGYVAEEFLNRIGQAAGFSKKRFFRGITLPPGYKVKDSGRLEDESQFPGDVVIVNGKWEKGKTIFDVVGNLEKGDIIIKGANAVNLDSKQAAIYIGHPSGGTICSALQAVVGRRVELYIPVGLEKRIYGNINEIAVKLNSPGAAGPRYMPVSGNIVTELEAVKIITGADAELVAAGGVCGAEGSCWVAATGNEEELDKADELMKSVIAEPNFVI